MTLCDGGLGLPMLCAFMRIAKRDRLNRLVSRAEQNNDAVLSWLVEKSESFDSDLKRSSTVKIAGQVVTNVKQFQDRLATDLYGTVDGRGLQSHGAVPAIHSWVSDGTRILSGSKYIGAIQVRCNSLFTKGRAARGRPSRDNRCATCKDFESLGHVLQTCAKTWAQRTSRHDILVKEVVTVLKKKNFEVMVEPRIPTSAGIRKPDIVAWQPGGPALVTDVTIVADHADLETVYVLKTKYYDTPEIRKWVSEQGQCSENEVDFSAVAFNWRGALSKKSARDLKDYGFIKSDLRWLSVTVLRESFGIYVFSRKSSLI